ncbi:winged helix-turn-helix domain-containing protein [Devosia sp. CN2-171]|uniref:winged helix-turn-helix domain-containing protein n=1 Tax=Devosia sp. CN2-171 TaxID=3400909 RepID=UPI003BF850D0
MKRTNEARIQFYILKLMQTKSVFSNARLKEVLSQELELSQADRAGSITRPNEAKWENLVNNALSPSRSNSLYSQGAVENCGHGLHRITDKGIHILHEQERWNEMFDEAFGDTLDDWT